MMMKTRACRTCGIRFDSEDPEATRCFYCRDGRADSLAIAAATGTRVVARFDATERRQGMVNFDDVQRKASAAVSFAAGTAVYVEILKLAERALTEKAEKGRADRLDAADARRRMVQRSLDAWRQ